MSESALYTFIKGEEQEAVVIDGVNNPTIALRRIALGLIFTDLSFEKNDLAHQFFRINEATDLGMDIIRLDTDEVADYKGHSRAYEVTVEHNGVRVFFEEKGVNYDMPLSEALEQFGSMYYDEMSKKELDIFALDKFFSDNNDYIVHFDHVLCLSSPVKGSLAYGFNPTDKSSVHAEEFLFPVLMKLGVSLDIKETHLTDQYEIVISCTGYMDTVEVSMDVTNVVKVFDSKNRAKVIACLFAFDKLKSFKEETKEKPKRKKKKKKKVVKKEPVPVEETSVSRWSELDD